MIEPKLNKEQGGCLGAIGPEGERASRQGVGASSNLSSPMSLSASQLHQIEKGAVDNIYHFLGEFLMLPTRDRASTLRFAMDHYQDAWMAGRRRVMD